MSSSYSDEVRGTTPLFFDARLWNLDRRPESAAEADASWELLNARALHARSGRASFIVSCLDCRAE